MTDLTEAIYTAMQAYGAPVLALALLLAALGVPLPATVLLLAAGAFAREGLLDGAQSAALALLGSILGDSASYWVGRYGGSLALRRISGSALWLRAEATFARRGALAILLTRFLLTPLALPTNLIAGSSRYAFRRFLAFDSAGELVWVLLYGGLGYLFADRWEALGDLAGSLSGLLVGLLVLATGAGLAFRHRRARVARGPVDLARTDRTGPAARR